MEQNVKHQIVEAVKNYMADNGLVQEAMADRAGVNVGYVNALLQGNYFVKVKNKEIPVKDSYFVKLAKAVGYQVEKVYWHHVETCQYLQIQTELLDAKSGGRTKMIIGETGCGKTYTVDKFVFSYPVNTFRITVSDMHRLNDILEELCELMRIVPSGSRVSRLRKIAGKLKSIKDSGGKPIVIIDEAENLKLPALKMLKGFYDAIRAYASIVLIGTSQLTRKLEILEEKDVDGIPQFCRRFKAGKREIAEIRKDAMYAPFFESIEDDHVRQLVETLASNYGELNDYLEPALRDADRSGCALNENFFRHLFGLI